MPFLEENVYAIDTRILKLRKRGFPLAAEHTPPIGQAADWYQEVIQYVPRSGQVVARQIARLCDDDSQVTVPWRSLADAVGVRNKAGNLISYTQRGVQVLIDAGWLSKEVEGRGCTSRTTFELQVGNLYEWQNYGEEEEYEEEI